MSAITLEFVACPGQPVAASVEAVGPQIGSPCEPRCGYRTVAGVEVEAVDAGDLRVDECFDGKARLIRIRLWIEAGGRVAGVDPTREVAQPDVRQLLFHDPHDRAEVRRQALGRGRERSGGAGVRLFEPDRLRLQRRRSMAA